MCVFSKTSKIKFWRLHYKIMQKSASKDFIKTFPTYFSWTFLQHFSNRPSPNVEIILAYFYIIKLFMFITTFLADLFNEFYTIFHKI